MNKLLISFCLLLSTASFSQVKKISQLPAATSIGASDLIPIVQSGTTKKLPYSAMKRYNPYATTAVFTVYEQDSLDPVATELFNEYTGVTFTFERDTVELQNINIIASDSVFVQEKSLLHIVTPYWYLHIDHSYVSPTQVTFSLINCDGVLCGEVIGETSETGRMYVTIETYP